MLLLICATLLVAGPSGSHSKTTFPINLNLHEAYVRHGFNKTWLTKIPSNRDFWKVIPPSRDGKRTIRIRDLELPLIPKKKFLSTKRFKPQTFTILIPVEIEKKKIENILPGLFLAHIGANWEIYINGHLITREVYLNSEGEMVVQRAIENQVFPIRNRYLKNGRNIIGFKIIGNPVSRHTGFHWSEPFLLGDFLELEDLRKPVIPMVLNGIYLFIGLYHLFLFWLRRKDTYNLFFGLFSMSSFIYMFFRSDYIYDVILDTFTILKFEFGILFTIIPLFGSFLETILINRISRFTKIYAVYSLVLILLAFMFTQPFSQDILLIWQLTSFIALGYYMGFVLFKTFFSRLKTMKAEKYDNTILGSLKALGTTMYKTTPGTLMAGVVIATAGMIFDIIDSAFLGTGVVLSNYSFFVLIISIMLILANRFQYTHNRVEVLNLDLQEKISDLNMANTQLVQSEEKYRVLVENSTEIIFTMDKSGQMISANKAIRTYLGVDPEHVSILSIFDIIHEETNDFSEQVIREKIDELIETRKPVSLKTQFKGRQSGEPMSMQLRFEYLERENDDFEILGKAVPVHEDSLLDYFNSERQSYSISHYLASADDMSHRMTRNLRRYLPEKEITLVRIAVREMLINAIEHGSLGITYDEKTQAQLEDRFFELIMERQHDPRFRDRSVSIDYQINDTIIKYRITDQGEGFDHKVRTGLDNDEANREMHQHGRGISMAVNIFDEVTYNKKGNQVLLVKNL